MKDITNSLLLYAVTDRHWAKEKTLLEQTEEALKGGVTFVQVREKNLNENDFEKEAFELKTLCKKYNVPFVVNDNVLLAKKINADGVHVGQKDMNALNVREILGPDKIIGVSTQTVQEAILAERQGADYLGVGAVFPTETKEDAIDVSMEELKKICNAVKIPVIAIGGITKENVKYLLGTGIKGIAVISSLYSAKNIKTAAAELKEKAKQTVFTTKYQLSKDDAVIFDMDGTILDSMPYWKDTADLYLKKMGLTPEEKLGEKLLNKSLKHGAEYLRITYSLKKSDKEIIDGIRDVILQAYQNLIMPKDDVVLFLNKLKNIGVKTALATATDRNMFLPSFTRLGLSCYFDHILTCSEYNTSKTEATLYLKAAELLGSKIENTWVFEDAFYALKTANQAGFKTACIYDKSANESEEQLKKESTIYLKNYKEAISFFTN